MLQVQNLYKSYDPESVLSGVSFVLNDGEHVGLAGPNGSGKTTLLRCITGQERPDSGSVVLSPPDLTVGYLAQAFSEESERTMGQVVAASDAQLAEAEYTLQQAAEVIASNPTEEAMSDYTDALVCFEALGGYEREHQATAILH